MTKSIIKHSSKYMTGSFITAIVGMAMLKYYTSVFTVEEFGILALYVILIKYVSLFISLNLDSASTRLYFDYKDTKRDEYLSTIFWCITFMAIVIFGILLINMDTIVNFIYSGTELIFIIAIIVAALSVYFNFFKRILYNEEESTLILKYTIWQAFINHFSSFVLISVVNLGIIGRVAGQGNGILLVLYLLTKKIININLLKIRFIFNTNMAKETLYLSIPAFMALLQNFVFVYMDRAFIQHYLGSGAVGIYAFGFIVGQGISMVYESISQALLPKIYTKMKINYAEGGKELETFSYKYYVLLVILSIIIAISSPLLVKLLANSDYREASHVISFIVFGFMMGGFYKIPSLWLGFNKRVGIFTILALVSFGINALLNWILIPMYGIVGASFASFVGLFIYSFLIQVFTFNYVTLKYKIIIILLYFIIFSLVLSYFIRIQ
jgi:O-antigen/teichoic acid export membrane protein